MGIVQYIVEIVGGYGEDRAEREPIGPLLIKIVETGQIIWPDALLVVSSPH